MPLRAVIILAGYAILATLAAISVRRFVRAQGFEVSWLNRSLAPERRHLRGLTHSRDPALARRARRVHLLAVVLWWSFFPFAGLMIWATSSR
jgi:hypothetical protein